MKKKQYDSRTLINWVAIVVIFIALMFIFGVLDQKISASASKHVTDNAVKFDDTFSAIGATLLAMPIFFAVQGLIQALLITKRLNGKNALYWGLNVLLVLICLFVTYFDMITHSKDRNWTKWIVQIVLSVFYLAIMVLYDLWFWNNKRKDGIYIKNHMWLAIRAIIFMVTIQVVVNVMKPIFGRPRPDQWINDHRKFQYPFAISGTTGKARGASFPSGHVITAMCLYAITLMFFTKPGWKHYTINSVFGILIILVAFARIFSLNHYTTDTLMSMGIGALAYSLYLKLFNNRLISKLGAN